MSLPTPTKIVRDDGLVLWQYDWPGQSVSVAAPTQATADTAIQAQLAAVSDQAKPAPSPLAVAIAALETLDQTKPATIGDVVSALKLVGGVK